MSTYSRVASQSSMSERICAEASVSSSTHASLNRPHRSSSSRKLRSVVPRAMSVDLVGRAIDRDVDRRLGVRNGVKAGGGFQLRLTVVVPGLASRGVGESEHGVLRSSGCRYTLTRCVVTRQVVLTNLGGAA